MPSGLVVFLSKCPKLRILNLKQTGVRRDEIKILAKEAEIIWWKPV